MTNSEVTFAAFDALLREAGFTKSEEPDAVVRYVHAESDTVVLVRIRDLQSPVPWGTLASTRKILDGRGVLASADFDRRLGELERTPAKSGAAVNDIPHTAERPGRSRIRRERVGKDDQV
jgi:hypothetical protein